MCLPGLGELAELALPYCFPHPPRPSAHPTLLTLLYGSGPREVARRAAEISAVRTVQPGAFPAPYSSHERAPAATGAGPPTLYEESPLTTRHTKRSRRLIFATAAASVLTVVGLGALAHASTGTDKPAGGPSAPPSPAPSEPGVPSAVPAEPSPVPSEPGVPSAAPAEPSPVPSDPGVPSEVPPDEPAPVPSERDVPSVAPDEPSPVPSEPGVPSEEPREPSPARDEAGTPTPLAPGEPAPDWEN
ncbi:hypothetical protein GCM10009802_63920 [Streptomyces synnematoformans]|uniref:Uncharacterized protein n=1 Tax=Streptomyces synnematoformans TaxID=415721 RepID=A0ABP4KRD4_9ACTN